MLAESGQCTVIRVPVFTSATVCRWSMTGNWRSGSTLIAISWRNPRAVTVTRPDVRSSTNGIAISVLSALPWAPRSGAAYASLEETRTE